MMPVDKKEVMLLVKQYRLPAGRDSIEYQRARSMTAKMHAGGETGTGGRNGTARQKVEEAGFFLSESGICEGMMTIYLATGLTQGAAEPMEDERVRTDIVQ